MKNLSQHITEAFQTINEAKTSDYVDASKINKSWIIKRYDGSNDMFVGYDYSPTPFENQYIDPDYLKNAIGKDKIESFSWVYQRDQKKLFDVVLKNGEKRQIYSDIVSGPRKGFELTVMIHITEPLNPQSEIDLLTLKNHVQQFNKRVGNYDIYNKVTDTGNGRYEIEVTANSKRGIHSDAQKIAMENKPTLPAGFKYKTGFAYHDSGRTKMSHDNLSTTGYVDSEFSGSATFIVIKK